MEFKPANETLKVIHSRKSVRKYTEEAPSIETLETLCRAAMAAPSGKNVQPWSFVVVTKRESLDAMGEVLPFAKMLMRSQAAIVVCGNCDVEQGGQSYWYIDCSAAAQNILLAAESMGLGAVWTATYPYPERMEPVAEILGLPDHIKSLCVIPIGYPNSSATAKDRFDSSKIHHEIY